ncbi:hypothetical protein BUALT_Bualt05G0120300 [Buddleja alternifolia]|uniref:RING-type domain-containing protein n=1 Tax=Buddleja alternifolia TaxID=168488 RepID=A0AAV6XII9_9LAMI|nr:hypothetical protein BUALT_Bualt05G0120300 [Buddleja alternifolia]
MGLQNQLSDVSSESTLVFMVVLIAKSVSYLHSLLLTILHNLGLFSPNRDHHHPIHGVVGSGLASLILLCEQLNLNWACSYPNQYDGVEGPDTADCVVCLNRLGEGDLVRKLECRHVFHKDCFDGWLDHLNFNCPLCRSPVVSDEHVEYTRRRVAGDLFEWFPIQ